MGGRQAVRLTVQAARLALYGHTALWRRLATLARRLMPVAVQIPARVNTAGARPAYRAKSHEAHPLGSMPHGCQV